MCKKLVVFCLALVVGLSVVASADYIGAGNPLKVDITYAPDNQQPLAGWQNWGLQTYWTIPGSDFYNPLAADPWETPHAQLGAYRKNQSDSTTGFSSRRSGGCAIVAGTGEYSADGKGFGMNYLELTITGLAPSTSYNFYLWSFESSWAAYSPCKYGVWSTTNPMDWLDTYWSGIGGEPPEGGYGPPAGGTDSNMPAGLAALVAAEGGRTFMMPPDGDNANYVGGTDYRVSFWAATNEDGAISIYGWIDPSDWDGLGNQHMPLNGFKVVPEPATLALLGLGGLALLRKRRA